MTSIYSGLSLKFERTIRFGDSDAAGVIHFHNLFRWCHESWEESLEKFGINPLQIFPAGKENNEKLTIALPIVHCEADFKKQIKTGDKLLIKIQPEKINDSCFEVNTEFEKEGRCVAMGLIRHIAINNQTRCKCALPEAIELWIEASSINTGPKPI